MDNDEYSILNSGAGASPAGPAVAVPIFSLKKKKTSVSLEDCLSFSRGLSSVVCLSWKIQSIKKMVEGSAGYPPARERLCPTSRAGREQPQF